MEGSDFSVFQEIPVSAQHIINCSYSSWYQKLSKHVPKSKILKPLPKEFIEYLTADGIILPKEQAVTISIDSSNEYSDWSDDEAGESAQVKTVSKQSDPVLAFEELDDQITQAIKGMGPVVPKLNWSAPKDAAWIMTNNSMKCYNRSDVYLILNSSSHIAHDIDHAFDTVNDKTEHPSIEYELILRKWFDINPALEFRVFVKNRTIRGISQRDLNYYDYLSDLSSTIVKTINDFFQDVLLNNFSEDYFVFDVYLPRPFNKTWLIDINPFCRKTDSLLFSWNEILDDKTPIPDSQILRLVTQFNSGRFAAKEHSENQVPRDVVEASLDSGSMVDLARKWQSLMAQEQDSSSSDGEDSD